MRVEFAVCLLGAVREEVGVVAAALFVAVVLLDIVDVVFLSVVHLLFVFFQRQPVIIKIRKIRCNDHSVLND